MNRRFVVMTVQRGDVSEVPVSGSGLRPEVRIGDQEVLYDGERIEMKRYGEIARLALDVDASSRRRLDAENTHPDRNEFRGKSTSVEEL
jgi:hypothetical protein